MASFYCIYTRQLLRICMLLTVFVCSTRCHRPLIRPCTQYYYGSATVYNIWCNMSKTVCNIRHTHFVCLIIYNISLAIVSGSHIIHALTVYQFRVMCTVNSIYRYPPKGNRLQMDPVASIVLIFDRDNIISFICVVARERSSAGRYAACYWDLTFEMREIFNKIVYTTAHAYTNFGIL